MEKVIVNKCLNYNLDNLLNVLKLSFDELGGINRFVQKGQKVLLKPNLIMAEKAEDGATTNPAIVEAMIIILKEQGAQVALGDSPAFGSILNVAKTCGIFDVIKKHNVPLIKFKGNRNIYRRANADSSQLLQQLNPKLRKKVKRLSTITPTINDFDVIINLPKLKAHVQMMLTCAVKNLYGLINGKVKAYRHFAVRNDKELFALFILHIFERVSSELTIVDAIDTMERKGPRGGEVARRGILLMGANALAVDRVILELMQQEVDLIPILRYATKYNMYPANINDIEIINPNNCNLSDFKHIEYIADISFSLPRLIKSVFKHLLELRKNKS